MPKDDATGMEAGDVKTHSVAASIPVAGMTMYAGWHSKRTENDMDDTKKLVTGGVMGPPGDTGMSFAVNFADNEEKGTNPWNFHVSRGLGGGASLALEHINADDYSDGESETVIQLRVDF